MSGIYIHIPFCGKRCSYCDFYLITNTGLIDKFVENLKKEIHITSEEHNKENFDTIFFGGGTPSLLTHYQVADILGHLNKYFQILSNAEITIEANPEDFLNKDIADYKAAGINRLSLGVQSFKNDELKFLTRQHTSEEAESVIRKSLKHLDNINADIIYSLPDQSLEDLDFSLMKAASLGVPHISAYTLTYEERTPLYKAYQKKLVKKNSDSKEAEMYSYVSDRLTSSGYRHYEVSNFSVEGFQCRHNLKYWQYQNYIGFGPSAHSMVDGVRWNNYRDIIGYNSDLMQNKLPVENKYLLSSEQKTLEYLMLALRSTGVDLAEYEKIFKEEFVERYKTSIDELLKNNYAELSNDRFHLNGCGYALADEIVAKYF
ncbi:MAG: radical SAM family heme chaperone HemW [bacterium]